MNLRRGSYRREVLTLAKLAEEGKHTYWKFSQSEKGRSDEAHYIEYCKMLMYGEYLTKFVFDNANEKFIEIGECQVRYAGGLGEYESKKLLTEKYNSGRRE